MTKYYALISAGLMTLALTACAPSNYVMHTDDGRTIVTQGKPKTDEETGMIKYKDASGVQQQINRADVKEMMALDN